MRCTREYLRLAKVAVVSMFVGALGMYLLMRSSIDDAGDYVSLSSALRSVVGTGSPDVVVDADVVKALSSSSSSSSSSSASASSSSSSSASYHAYLPLDKMSNLVTAYRANAWSPSVNVSVTMCDIAPFPNQTEQWEFIRAHTGSSFPPCSLDGIGNIIRFQRAPYDEKRPFHQGTMTLVRHGCASDFVDDGGVDAPSRTQFNVRRSQTPVPPLKPESDRTCATKDVCEYMILKQERGYRHWPAHKPYGTWLKWPGGVLDVGGVPYNSTDHHSGSLLLLARCSDVKMAVASTVVHKEYTDPFDADGYAIVPEQDTSLRVVVIREPSLVARVRRVTQSGRPLDADTDPLPGVDSKTPNPEKQSDDGKGGQPDIVFVLMDSYSRANWMRQMQHTQRLLRRLDWSGRDDIDADDDGSHDTSGDSGGSGSGDHDLIDDFVSYQFVHYQATGTYTPGNEFPMLSGYPAAMAKRFGGKDHPNNSMHTWVHEYARRSGYVVGAGHVEEIVHTKHNANASPSAMWRPWEHLTGHEVHPRLDYHIALPAFGYHMTNAGRDECQPRGERARTLRFEAHERENSLDGDGKRFFFTGQGSECTMCVGNRQASDLFYEWGTDFLHAFSDVPRYLHVTDFEGHQANPAAGRQHDRELAQFLRRVMRHQANKNTVIVLVADHGVGYPPTVDHQWGIREVMLPFFNVIMPRSLLRRHAGLARTLAENTMRMVTPYDLHTSLLHLMDYPRRPDPYRFQNNTAPHYDGPHDVYSIFNATHPLPFRRTCEEAQVSTGASRKDPLVCACAPLSDQLSPDDYQMSPRNLLNPVDLAEEAAGIAEARRVQKQEKARQQKETKNNNQETKLSQRRRRIRRRGRRRL